MTQSVTGIDHLSYSSISTYLMCGQCWKMRYVDKLPALKSPSLIFGGAFHEATEAYILQNAEGREKTPLTEIWDASWTAKLEAEKDNIDWGEESADDLRAEGVRILTTPEIVQTLDSITPMADDDGSYNIERRVEMDVSGVPVPVIGFVDLISADGIPGDFKTSSQRWAEKRAGGELQAAVYIAALEQEGYTGNPERRFRYYVFTRTKSPRAQVLETQREDGDFTFMYDLVREVWKGISAGVFVPNPVTWKCSSEYCEYWHTCRGRYLQ